MFAEMTPAEQLTVVTHMATFFGVQPPEVGHRLAGPHFLKAGAKRGTGAKPGGAVTKSGTAANKRGE